MYGEGSLTYAQATFAHPLLYLGGKPPRPPLAHLGESEQMSPEQMSRYPLQGKVDVNTMVSIGLFIAPDVVRLVCA